jgi:hypothetical protein
VRRSDDDDTDVRRMGIIIQLNDKGYCKEQGCANNTDVGQLSIMQNSNGRTRHYTTMVQTWTTQHHAMIKCDDKALYNNQLDEAWDGMRGGNAEDWSTRLYTTINLMRTRDIVRRSDLQLKRGVCRV